METNTIYNSNKKLLLKWKITNDSMCNFCKEDEDYFHYFISCNFLECFWTKICDLLKRANLEFSVKLKHIIFGYKTFDDNYFGLNYFLTILSFSVYKSYYVSEQKTKHRCISNFCK